MIHGVVKNREALVELEVSAGAGKTHRIEAVIDTGYNGYLTLPSHIVAALQLPSAGQRRGTLADGSVVRFEVFIATVNWHAKQREVLVSQMSGAPLVGMSLLNGSRLTIDASEGGRVSIEELKP